MWESDANYSRRFQIEEALTTACESLQFAVEATGVEVFDISKEYEGLVEHYKYKFDHLSWEYQKMLSKILDLEETAGPNSASSSRTSLQLSVR